MSTFAGGLDTFFFKGANGRWRAVLGPDELPRLERAKARAMTPDCAAFMEQGPRGAQSAMRRPAPD